MADDRDMFRPNSVASLTDILTAAKNIVVALNTASQINSNALGTTTKAAISAATTISGQPGRLVKIIVTTAGSVTGTANDAISVSNASASNVVFTIPNTTGVYEINIPVMYGLVVTPGTGQVVTVTYS